MKKSAEIAAVFSGARINQTTNIVNENDEEEVDDAASLSSTDVAYDTKRSGCQCGSGNGSGIEPANVRRRNFSKANMQSTLGYFP